jgi:hypothetical protein
VSQGWESFYPPSILKLFLGKSLDILVMEAPQVLLLPPVAQGICSPIILCQISVFQHLASALKSCPLE